MKYCDKLDLQIHTVHNVDVPTCTCTFAHTCTCTCMYMYIHVHNHLYRVPQCTGEKIRKRKRKKEDTHHHNTIPPHTPASMDSLPAASMAQKIIHAINSLNGLKSSFVYTCTIYTCCTLVLLLSHHYLGDELCHLGPVPHATSQKPHGNHMMCHGDDIRGIPKKRVYTCTCTCMYCTMQSLTCT